MSDTTEVAREDPAEWFDYNVARRLMAEWIRVKDDPMLQDIAAIRYARLEYVRSLLEARADAARLDWLEGEARRIYERSWPGRKEKCAITYDALFLAGNLRAAIDRERSV